MGDFCLHDNILNPVTYDDLVLVAQNINPASGRTLEQEFKQILRDRREDALYEFQEHYDDIMAAAFPERKEVELARSAEELESIAWEIQKWLRSHEMWMDVSIYYAGKRMSTCSEVNGKTVYRYNGDPFIEDGFDPRDYCEYANPRTITIIFEGTFYEVMNGHCPGCVELEAEFSRLINKHGFYYEMGHAYNLSLYEVTNYKKSSL